ncbi:MAG: type VI secretion system tip protein VgrG [Polyangiaceae bacterium]|nr:type VI secretion system tip protein VgrG [Polyangiaceae bacterium]
MREQRPLFESKALDDALEVRALTGQDELNQLFQFQLQVRRPGVVMSDEDAAQLLESPASVRFVEDDETLQHIFGIISKVTTETDPESDTTDLFLELVPRVWLLTHRRGSEIFLGKTVPQVIAEKLIALGLKPHDDFAFALRSDYPGREIITQHEETDYAFICRLCEHNGIVSFFEHREGKDVWIFTDTPSTHHPITRPRIQVARKRVHPSAWNVQTALRRVPSQAETLDYNYRTPLVGLRENKPISTVAAQGNWVEYGPHTKNPLETAKFALIRTEEHSSRHHIVTTHTTEASVRAGGTFELIDTVGNSKSLLITKATFHFQRAEGGTGAITWENKITAIPSNIPFRPARTTPWPRISGLINAVVDGAIKGDYAELDEVGRYHLRMVYDRSGKTDLGATHPVRMMQPHAGANYGMHFPLRPGTEVLVGFVNGDPDRPVIIGTAPNPVTSSPVERKNQTQNVLRTGSNNEMVIEDEHGTERIRIHTPHQNTTVQLGAIQEPEEGALTRTQANITQASRLSNNESTPRKTSLSETTTSLVGRSAVIAAGAPSMTTAAQRGMDEPSAYSPEEISRDLTHLSLSPAAREEKSKSGQPEEKSPTTVPYSGTWSSMGADVSERTQSAMNDLVRNIAAATDNGLDQAHGRTQGEPLGSPLDPSAIIAAERTAALIGREVGVVYGDRTAAVSSHHTASVMGREKAFLKSPGQVEIAAGNGIQISTPATIDAQSKLVRVVAGYYPGAEPPPLDEGTSIGVMSKRDLRIISVEDCILVCAKKNVISTAHDGDWRLTASGTVAIKGGSIDGSAGSIKFKSSDTIDIDADGNITITSAGDIAVEAAGSLLLKGADVTVEGGTITLKGPTTVQGDLTVTGAISGG